MSFRFLIAAVLLCGMVITVRAEPGCAELSGDTAKRTCQTKARRSYSEDLEARLSKIGSAARVIPEEIGDPGSGAYPRLIIWAPLTKNKVYELIDAAKILADAREVGFRMIVFVEKGLGDYWYFDLTKPGTRALDVVPPRNPPWKPRAEK